MEYELDEERKAKLEAQKREQEALMSNSVEKFPVKSVE
jgi:hypothetical protein